MDVRGVKRHTQRQLDRGLLNGRLTTVFFIDFSLWTTHLSLLNVVLKDINVKSWSVHRMLSAP